VTLIITDISRHGVVMAADSAETQEFVGMSGRKYSRVLVGLRKLHSIQNLKGAVAFWGLGEIQTLSGPARTPTDIWLADFIARNDHLVSLEQVAYTLRSELQKLLGSEAPELGFHVAGMGANGEPLFFRICNHTKARERRPEFEVDKETLAKFKEEPITLSDGDTNVYRQVISPFDQTKPVAVTSQKQPIPHDTLAGRMDYHAAWVRFVSDLYQSGNLLRSIGGNVHTVAIDPNGFIKSM